MHIYFSTAEYFRTHCREPRGWGTWGFRIAGITKGYGDTYRRVSEAECPVVFSKPMTYGQAKRWLREALQARAVENHWPTGTRVDIEVAP